MALFLLHVVAAEAREPPKPLNFPPREVDLHLRVSLRLDLEARPKHAAASRLELIHDSHSTDLRAGDARVSSLETFTVTRGAAAFAPRLLRPYEPLRTTRALVDPAVQPPAERAAAAADAAAAKAIRDDVTAGVIGYLQLEVQLDDLYE